MTACTCCVCEHACLGMHMLLILSLTCYSLCHEWQHTVGKGWYAVLLSFCLLCCYELLSNSDSDTSQHRLGLHSLSLSSAIDLSSVVDLNSYIVNPCAVISSYIQYKHAGSCQEPVSGLLFAAVSNSQLNQKFCYTVPVRDSCRMMQLPPRYYQNHPCQI